MKTKMNTALRYVTLFAAGATLWLTTGCNTVSTFVRQDIGGPTYPSSDPAQVEILRAVPTRQHVRLGEVQAQPSSDSVPVAEIETRAAQSRRENGR